MKAIATVIGKDRVGIIADVSALLAQRGVNVLDISQTVLQDYFTMIMLVDISGAKEELSQLSDECAKMGAKIGMSIHLQHEEIFNAMHRV